MIKDQGYSTVAVCQALAVSRGAYYRAAGPPHPSPPDHRESRDAELLERIRALCQEHPAWGYRRVTAWLQRREDRRVNRKRVYRLMRQHGLTVKQKTYAAKRTPTRSKPQPDRANQWWGLDMTKFMIPSLGWAYLVVVLDWYTRKIVGHTVGLQSKSGDWLEALNQALNRQFPDGVRDRGLHLMSDNGTQPTSVAFIKACANLKIEQAFTSYNNPKGNANTERVIRTLKEDCLWINEWDNLDQAQREIENWIWNYNHLYPHSALGYLSPVEFEQQISTPKAA
jgi:transposase InsO family protein